jgi:hypothetical protein
LILSTGEPTEYQLHPAAAAARHRQEYLMGTKFKVAGGPKRSLRYASMAKELADPPPRPSREARSLCSHNEMGGKEKKACPKDKLRLQKRKR